jgi:tetratricopeptide (TPR) repeat protein
MKLYLRIAVTLYLLLLLAAASGYVDLWGVYHLTVFPCWVVFGLATISLGILWTPIGIPSLIEKACNLGQRLRPRGIIPVSLMVVASVLFILGRSKNHLLGDGFQRLSMVETDAGFSFTEYLDVAAHRLMYLLLGDAELSYVAVGVLSGILFLIVVYSFARRLSPNPVTRVGAVLTILGIAQIQFFFGYAESYSIMTALAAFFIYVGYTSVLRRSYLWIAVALFAIAGLFHVTAWCLFPGVICLLWIRGSKQKSVTYKVLGILLLVAGSAALVLLYGKLRSMNALVEIQPTEDKLYALFSAQHFADLANILLLVAPLPLIILIGSLFFLRKRIRLWSRPTAFLFFSLIGSLVFAFVAEPNLGAVRDWDLLALFGVPAAFLAAYSGAVVLKRKGERQVLVAAGLAILLMHTVPWVCSNTSKTLTVEHLKRHIAADVHYSAEHLSGARLKSWGYLMEMYYDDLEEKERAMLLRLQGNPGDVHGWLNLARVSFKLGKREQARSALEVIEDFTPQIAHSFKNMVLLYIELGEIEKAATKLSLGIDWFPDDPDVYFLGGAIGQLMENYETSAMLYQKAVVLSPKDKDALMNYAEVLIILGDYEEARTMLDRALALSTLTAADRGKITAFRKRMGQ